VCCVQLSTALGTMYMYTILNTPFVPCSELTLVYKNTKTAVQNELPYARHTELHMHT
jgi:hypothetical protein